MSKILILFYCKIIKSIKICHTYFRGSHQLEDTGEKNAMGTRLPTWRRFCFGQGNLRVRTFHLHWIAVGSPQGPSVLGYRLGRLHRHCGRHRDHLQRGHLQHPTTCSEESGTSYNVFIKNSGSGDYTSSKKLKRKLFLK